MEAAPVSQWQRGEQKSMKFHRKCQPGLTFWRLQPPESERSGEEEAVGEEGGGGQEIGGDEVKRKEQDRENEIEMRNGRDEEKLEKENKKRTKGRMEIDKYKVQN